MSLAYLDSSAIIKLVRNERETASLSRWLVERPGRISSVLGEIEIRRAVLRAGVQGMPVELVLEGVDLLPIDGVVAAAASVLAPPSLRSLDAIHLATALSIKDDLEAFVTYDRRLGSAASASGLRVAAPR